jgi:peptide deformylase
MSLKHNDRAPEGRKNAAMYEDLKIILYPDPRLTRISKRVEKFDQNLKQLAARMLILMREHKGVGLAAPQVGENIRLFVMNSTGKPEDDRVYVNPILSEPLGEEEAEEGCLSLPGINTKVLRSRAMQMVAQNLDGKELVELQDGYIARIWQHEVDHLNGVLLLDRMGPLAKMSARKTLKELEQRYKDERDEK